MDGVRRTGGRKGWGEIKIQLKAGHFVREDRLCDPLKEGGVKRQFMSATQSSQGNRFGREMETESEVHLELRPFLKENTNKR